MSGSSSYCVPEQSLSFVLSVVLLSLHFQDVVPVVVPGFLLVVGAVLLDAAVNEEKVMIRVCRKNSSPEPGVMGPLPVGPI